MAPLWLPWNIQKRVFRYLLNRLAFFSNIDLDNLDVAFSTTTTHLTLREVILDTEKLQIPGGKAYLRDGTIQQVDLTLGMMSGVVINGNDVQIIMAISEHSNVKDPLEFSAILERTTADLANSVFIDNKELDGGSPIEDSEVLENGTGEFSSVISSMIDSAVSHLTVNLRNILVKLVVDSDVTLELKIDSIAMTTGSDGRRHFEVSNLQLFHSKIFDEDTPISRGDGVDIAQQIDDSSEDDNDNAAFNSIYDLRGEDEDDEDNNDLMQSKLFSHEEASSIYMSAISDILLKSAVSPPELPLILWLDSLNLSFRGLDFEDLQIVLGSLHVAMSPITDVAIRLLNVLSKHQEDSKVDATRNQGDKQPETAPVLNGLSVNSLKISTSSSLSEPGVVAIPHHSLPVLSISDISLQTTATGEILLEISRIFAEANDRRILSCGSSGSPKDLTCHITSSEIRLLVPNVIEMFLSLPELSHIVGAYNDLKRLHNTIAKASSTLAFSASSITSSESIPTPRKVTGQTNSIVVDLAIDSSAVELTIFPISINDDFTISISRIMAQWDVDNSVELSAISLSTHSNPTVSIQQHDSTETLSSVDTKIQVDRVKLIGSADDLNNLLKHVKLWLNSLPSEAVSKPSTKTTSKKNITFEHFQTVSVHLGLSYFEGHITFPDQIGLLDLDVGSIDAHFLSSGNELQLSVASLHISRNFSDIDPDAGYVPLVRTANPHRKVSKNLLTLRITSDVRIIL